VYCIKEGKIVSYKLSKKDLCGHNLCMWFLCCLLATQARCIMQ